MKSLALTKCQAACNYMFSLRSLQSTQIEDRNEGESQSPPKGAAHLIVQKLQFHYPTKPDRLILRNLEFEVRGSHILQTLLLTDIANRSNLASLLHLLALRVMESLV